MGICDSQRNTNYPQQPQQQSSGGIDMLKNMFSGSSNQGQYPNQGQYQNQVPNTNQGQQSSGLDMLKNLFAGGSNGAQNAQPQNGAQGGDIISKIKGFL